MHAVILRRVRHDQVALVVGGRTRARPIAAAAAAGGVAPAARGRRVRGGGVWILGRGAARAQRLQVGEREQVGGDGVAVAPQRGQQHPRKHGELLVVAGARGDLLHVCAPRAPRCGRGLQTSAYLALPVRGRSVPSATWALA